MQREPDLHAASAVRPAARRRPALLRPLAAASAALLLGSALAAAQQHGGGGGDGGYGPDAPHGGGGMDLSHWFGVLELPFLVITIYFAFRTASALRGGVFGKGMTLMAWGFLVMAVGHIHMQVKHFVGFDLFSQLFGSTAGMVLWFVALVTTWLLSGLGFYNIFRASRTP